MILDPGPVEKAISTGFFFAINIARLNRAKRFLRYNVLASEREGIDAHTVVILLRPQANSTDLISPYQQHLPTGLQNITFTFDLIRVWEYPPATFLSGGPGLWSLAPLADVTPAELPNVMTELKVRWDTLPQPSAIDLANLTQLFMGLRYTRDTIRQLFRGFSGMEESVIYQEIEQIGIAKGEQIGIAKGEQIGIAKGESNGKVQMGQVALISVLEGKFGYVEPATQSAFSHH